MIFHSFDKEVTQKEIKDFAALGIIKSLASYFSVTEKKMETALGNLVKSKKRALDADLAEYLNRDEVLVDEAFSRYPRNIRL